MKRAIPNLFTLGNLAMGIMAILSITKQDLKLAAFFVILGMAFDALDGRIARALHVNNEIGKELDSLADIVTFGVVPSVLLYQLVFQDMKGLGLAITLLFPLCGAYRLAKFNVETHKIRNHFVGLPITMAGGILAVVSNYKPYLSGHFYFMLTLLLSILMISKIKYPNFKSVKMKKQHLIILPIYIVAIVILSKMYPEEMIKIILGSIVFIILISLFQAKRKVKRQLKKDDEILNEK